MTNKKLLKGKPSLIVFLSVILIIIGLIYILNGLNKVWSQPDYSITTNIEMDTKLLKEENTENTKILPNTVIENSNNIIVLEIKEIKVNNSIKNEEAIVKEEATTLSKDLDKKIIETNIQKYPLYPKEGERFGILIIPILDLELPIIQGTSAKDLDKGVGHFLQSVFPGENDNSVLSAHRNTYFKKIGKLVIGDLLITQTSKGTFTYKVSGTRIVSEDDRTVIVPTDHAVLTLTTCYPFDAIGSAPERYIVSADLILSDLD